MEGVIGGVSGERRIPWKLKGKVLSPSITPAYLHGLDTIAENQQHKVQVCETNGGEESRE